MGSPTRQIVLSVCVLGLLLVVIPGRTGATPPTGLSPPVFLAGGAALAPAAARPSVPERPAPLGLEERIARQRAIEEVYWRHRIWPDLNPGSKPPLSALLSEVELRRKVEDALLKSSALATLWDRPITAAQLGAEVARMARGTKDPNMLRELWEALGRDPVLVAECLARPILADRLVRNWYAFDDRFHGEVRARAESELGTHGTVQGMQAMSGRYEEQVWRRPPEAEATDPTPGDPKVRILGEDEWRTEVARLHEAFGLEDLEHGAELARMPDRVMTPLQEDESRFYVLAVLERDSNHLTLATVSWPKVSFDDWWDATRSSLSPSLPTETASDGALPEVAQTACTDDTWSPMQHLPIARDGHIAVWTGSEMIVWGGALCASDGAPGGRYDPATDSWITINATEQPPNRYRATGVWTGTELIVWGGGWCGPSGSGGAENDGGRYNPTTDAWTPTSITGNVPSPRIDHAAVWSGTEMIVWGGTPTFGSCPGTGEGCTRTGARYDPNTDSWTPTTVVGAPVGRRAHTAVWTGSEMIVWGGAGAGQIFNDGARYAPATDTWTPTSTTGAPAARVRHTAVWAGDEMIIWGGCRSDGCFYPNLDSGGRYDPVTDAWTPTTLAGAPYQRHDHTAVWTGTEMIVWGGCSDADCSDFRSSGARYDPANDAWTPTATTGVPFARAQHSAVWTGTEMIVWGGCYGGECVIETASGGRYDPAADSWVPTSGATSPDRRRRHSAVWTGSELIIWGGQSGSEYRTGKRYDPATDHWTSVNWFTVRPRSWHTTVWTGTEMIVWGGTVRMQGSPNTGDRYDPQTDTWTPTSVTGAPAGRIGHTAVWTGTEMIIWGGNGGTSFDTGGRYDPAADTWTATTTANAPSARLDHTAVWTGDGMIVWGGRSEFAPSGSSGLETGGRYDPAADTWTATTTANAPSARLYHATVWSGAEMIVWGGENVGVALGDGARYRPATDVWTPVSAASAPDPRTGHTGVWSGAEMIVWGGEGTPFPLWPADEAMRTGGRYDPAADAWRPTSTGAYAPAARSGHTATWGGGRMFVFGGVNPKTEPGAAYCASAPASVGVESPGPPARLEFAVRPNPARGSATLAFDLDQAAEVTVRVFDLAGREVARPLAGERIPPGRTARLWQPDRLPDGLYFLHAVVAGRDMVRRLVLLQRH